MPLAKFAHSVRRHVTDASVSALLSAATVIPGGWVARAGRTVGLTASVLPPLRRRLLTNLQLALGPAAATQATADGFFRRFGRLLDHQARVYGGGLEALDLDALLKIDASIAHLDEAVSRGRGVILGGAHLFEYELAAALISRRYRVVGVTRESPRPRRQALKDRWFRMLGIETVRRPRAATSLWDLQTCLSILDQGAVLAITPDLVVAPDEGVAVTLFGRVAHVKPGLAALAMYSGSPVVNCRSRGPDNGRREMFFLPPEVIARPAGGRRKTQSVDEALRTAMQEWFSDFETYLREHPHEWLFWLDKRWTRVIRSARQEAQVAA